MPFNTFATEMASNRHTVSMGVALRDDCCNKLKADNNQRVMLYCCAASGLAPYSPLDISFPGQIEVKVNGDDVKSNFKGLKNKPGTTKPADITDLVRKAPNYVNNLQITYALTNKVRYPDDFSNHDTALSSIQKYTVQVYLVQKTSADSLAEQIKQGRFFAKAQVLSESKCEPC